MCWFCGAPVGADEPIGRSYRCENCGKDLRVCKNCRFYVPGARGDCSESSAEPPAEKDRANFCGWFSLNPVYRAATAGRREERDQSRAAKSAFDELFK
jgi:hypothetical protein